jgi:hypothetical protein
MKRQTLLLVITLMCIALTAGVLLRMRSNQKLGLPGVATAAVEDPEAHPLRCRVVLPEKVLNYTSQEEPTDKITLEFLPADTSYGQRRYRGSDNFEILTQVVLMGTDRTSIHKPQFCLGGQGWAIDETKSGETSVRIERPTPYDLPVMKLITTRELTYNGQRFAQRGIFVYWFVAREHYTARHWQRMWWMAKDVLRTGELQRWAYVTCFAVCRPGEEDATFERMKGFIAASVPEFQLVPAPADAATAFLSGTNPEPGL